MIDKISKNIDKIVLFLILMVSIYYIYTLSIFYKKDESLKSIDNALLLTKNLLQEEEWHAQSLSILLSNDEEFLNAFYAKDRKAAFNIINKKINTLKIFQNYTFEVQVHDKNLNTYFRNWDYNITNIPLASFRDGLVIVKNTKKPLVSIENGKRLNIKAISPILKDKKFMGSIEVIEGFDHLRQKLLEHGYILYVVLDLSCNYNAKSFSNYQYIENKYVLVHKFYDKNSFNALKSANLSNLKSYGYFTQDNYYFGYFEIKNFNNKKLGYCIVTFQDTNKMNINKHYQYISRDNNFSKVIIR